MIPSAWGFAPQALLFWLRLRNRIKFCKNKDRGKNIMSIYADIKFEMKDNHKASTLHDSQCGEFRDTVLEIIKIYDEKHENKKPSQTITLSGDELAEFAKIYADEVQFEPITFLIEDKKHDWAERKEKLLFDYYKNGEFSIEDNQIVGYNCDKAQTFMPIYNLYKEWARQDALQGKTNIEENLPIFKRYVQLTLEGKMFFGVQISKIESVTLELC